MHLEFLVEDSSGAKLLEILLNKIFEKNESEHSWRIHPYKGVGRISKDLKNRADPAKRQLLDQLPRLLSGFGKTSGIDAVVIVIDVDNRNSVDFLVDLKNLAINANAFQSTLYGLAIEEMEAWYFGDSQALKAAYPSAKKKVLDNYVQDSICGTWERLADAIYPGGSKAIKNETWVVSGTVKHEWAKKIGAHMNVNKNKSPSFCKFRDDLRKLVENAV